MCQENEIHSSGKYSFTHTTYLNRDARFVLLIVRAILSQRSHWAASASDSGQRHDQHSVLYLHSTDILGDRLWRRDIPPFCRSYTVDWRDYRPTP